MDLPAFLELLKEKDSEKIIDVVRRSPFWSRLTSSETNAPDVYEDLEAFFLPTIVKGLVQHPSSNPALTQNMFLRITDQKWGPIIASWIHEAFREVFNFSSRGAPQEVVHALNAKKPEEAVELLNSIGAVIQEIETYKKTVKDSTKKLLS
ncbi:hypothetical protein ACFLRC_00910 [Candidatus Altiarchaeota archaeon]